MSICCFTSVCLEYGYILKLILINSNAFCVLCVILILQIPKYSWLYQFWATVITTDGSYIVQTCQNYPDMLYLDGSWKAARAFSVIGFVLIIMLLIIKCCVICNSESDPVSAKLDAPLYLLLSLSQGLMLLLLSSKVCKSNPLVEFGNVEWQETCSMDTGAKCTISAMVFWFVAAVTSSALQDAKRVEMEEREIENDSTTLTEPFVP